MNQPNQPFEQGQPYAPQRIQSIRIILDRKMHYQQIITAMFGRERLQEINESDQPFILPLVQHQVSFYVWIYFLV